jgi:quinol monooxygenase YgiN
VTEFSLFATITPAPAHYSDALTALQGIIQQTRAEPGCLCFELNTDQGLDANLYLVEHWASPQALDDHYAQPYTVAVFNAYQGWLACPPQIVKMDRNT